MKRSLIQVFSANVIILVLGMVNGFLLPKYLSIESYGMIKTYQLYLSYLGLLHFGYIDGMYLKYGGENFQSINKVSLGKDYYTFKIFQLVPLLIIFVLGFYYKKILLILIAPAIWLTNVNNYHKFLFQSIGEFKKYGETLKWVNYFIVIGNLILILLNKDDYIIYIIMQILATAFVVIYENYQLKKNLLCSYEKFSFLIIKNNIQKGFVLMIGNFLSTILTGMDRWFIKIFLPLSQFSVYSFAVSLDSMLNTFVTPISVTMYNYLCKNEYKNNIIKIKCYLLILGSSLVTVAFPIKIFIKTFLIDYYEVIDCMFILFTCQIFNLVIKGIYINLYKADGEQSKYTKQMVLIMIIGFVSNIIFIKVMKSKEGIAIATLITNCIWFVICELKSNVKYRKSEYFAMTLIICSFLFGGIFCNPIFGGIIYISSLLLIFVTLLKKDFMELIKIGIQFGKNLIRK